VFAVLIALLGSYVVGQAIGVAQGPELSGSIAVKVLDCLGSADQVKSGRKKNFEVGELERTEAIHHVNLNLLKVRTLIELDSVKASSLYEELFVQVASPYWKQMLLQDKHLLLEEGHCLLQLLEG
jgi:hypothetical protein